MVMESDVSTRGSGATCDGVRTGRPWSPEESQWHINCLEALPGVLNMAADEESWVMKDCSDWKLNLQIFCGIQQHWGPLSVDLFASRLTTQLTRFFSLRPDPEVEALDTFTKDWSRLQRKAYANPPWNLVGRVLARVCQQMITIVLIAPVWRSQPVLLESLVDFPILLPPWRNLILPTHPESAPGMMPQLATLHISGNAIRTKKFLRKAQSCSSHLGGTYPPNLITPSSESGLAGVMNGVPIQFQDLSVR